MNEKTKKTASARRTLLKGVGHHRRRLPRLHRVTGFPAVHGRTSRRCCAISAPP
jgi:hypothetical protein